LRDRRITEAQAVEIRGNVREVLERALKPRRSAVLRASP
jgi:hypothetical protein